jgi:hypothetical protein
MTAAARTASAVPRACRTTNAKARTATAAATNVSSRAFSRSACDWAYCPARRRVSDTPDVAVTAGG